MILIIFYKFQYLHNLLATSLMILLFNVPHEILLKMLEQLKIISILKSIIITLYVRYKNLEKLLFFI